MTDDNDPAIAVSTDALEHGFEGDVGGSTGLRICIDVLIEAREYGHV